MAQAFSPGLQIKDYCRIKKTRELSVAGEVLVKVGDLVKSDTIVARAELAGDLIIVRAAEQLGIEAHEIVSGLKVKVGDTVKVGDILCEHAGLFGLFKSRLSSPCSGTVDFISDNIGHLGIRLQPKHLEINAYVSGKVVAVEARKSVTIECVGAFVQGIFGVGGERSGILKALPLTIDQMVEEKHIAADLKGAIVFGGSSISVGALSAAAAAGAVGVVTGSIDDRTLASYLGYDIGLALTGNENVPMTLILTEGFGNISMSPRIFELLKKLEGRRGSISGATQVRAGALRPEIIVADDSSQPHAHVEATALCMQIGSAVRLIRVPYFGMIGTVIDLPFEPRQIESGAFARVLKARLKDGSEVVVPRANVELIAY